RQALAIGLVRGERRGLAASLNAVSMQLPNAIGPTITGYFFQIGRLVLPFYIAALFQAAYIVIYRKFFSGYELSQEE
ncbi:MAG: MFS transporter, partial [bacterium]